MGTDSVAEAKAAYEIARTAPVDLADDDAIISATARAQRTAHAYITVLEQTLATERAVREEVAEKLREAADHAQAYGRDRSPNWEAYVGTRFIAVAETLTALADTLASTPEGETT